MDFNLEKASPTLGKDFLREEALSAPPRGVAPLILLEQVRNTAPFLFTEPEADDPSRPYAQTILKAQRRASLGAPLELSHVEYYQLCLSAHHATVATFVPTDVDNQIRFKLWHPSLPLADVRSMAELVSESLSWDWTYVSTRIAQSPESGEKMSGHQGEWFSTAVGAYGALRKKDPDAAAEIAGQILREVQREGRILQDLKNARDGIGIAKASTVIAHNLGDLNRVVEMWSIPADDPFCEAVAKETTGLPFRIAEKVNRVHTAVENPRHFALRAARCLRPHRELLLPLGPFLDDWGRRVASHEALGEEDLGSVIEALIDGWRYLKGTIVGYARALNGIESGLPGGLSRACDLVPSRIAKEWKTGVLRQQCSVEKRRFEEGWDRVILNAAKSV